MERLKMLSRAEVPQRTQFGLRSKLQKFFNQKFGDIKSFP